MTPPVPSVGSGPPGPVDLRSSRSIRIVGIGGAGLSAMAEVLANMGHRVTGSDLAPGPAVDRLRSLGLAVTVGHDPAAVANVDMVVRSTAVGSDDAELSAATAAGVPVLSRADLLAGICTTRRTLAVSGTHGKTTTSALTAAALVGAGLRPAWVLGAAVAGLGPGGHWDAGEYLVVEADESDGTFLALPRELSLVTNVEADHLDHHGTIENLEEAFGRFLAECDGPRLVCADDPRALAIGVGRGARTYGLAAGADYRVTDVEHGGASVAFDLALHDRHLGRVTVALPGIHNALNAAGAMAAALEIGAGFDGAAAGIGRVAGVARRFELRGQRGGVTFIDDYAHHPGEVKAALAAARAGRWERIVCVFQPHRYTRTEALASEFGPALAGADLVVVTGIYGAGEAPRPGVTGELVARALEALGGTPPVVYEPDRAALAKVVASLLRPGDLCITLGAGNLTLLPDEILGDSGWLPGADG